MDPAHGLLGVDEIHGSCLLGVDRDGVGSAQRGGLDVLGVGNQEVRMPIYRVLNADGVLSLSKQDFVNTMKRETAESVCFDSHRSWPCRSGCPAEAGSPPHSCRCRSLRCWCTFGCTSRIQHTH